MLLLCISVFSVGCAENIRMYSGPKLPKSKVAKLVSGHYPDLTYLSTLHVDGKQIIPDPNSRKLASVEMLPGLHNVEAKLVYISCERFHCTASKREFTHCVRGIFDAEAGKEYVIAAAILCDVEYRTQPFHPDNVYHISKGIASQVYKTTSGHPVYKTQIAKETAMWIEEWKKNFGNVVVGKRPAWRVKKRNFFTFHDDLICFGSLLIPSN